MQTVFAQDPVDTPNTPFEEGSVLVICGKPVGGPDLSSEEFLAGYPEWISTLTLKANEGIVTRAHYLGTIKEGVFIVFAGPDKDDAMKNAKDVVAHLQMVYARVTGNDEDICKFLEIGPIAALSR